MSAHVITVAQQKGGVGKSTLAVHLAVAFAKQGYSTMLFDTDPQGTVSHWHAQRKQSDIGLIATSGWRLTRDLAMAREANDVIIIDTPPHAEMDIKVSTRAADMVMVPLQPSPADLWAVKETMNTVAGESTNAMVVLNRVVARANITKDIQEKLTMMEIPVAKATLGNRVLFAAAMEAGMTVLDGFKNPAMDEMDELVKEVAGILGMSVKTTKRQQRASAQETAGQPANKKAASKPTTKKPAAKTSTKRQAPTRAKMKKAS
jgi:chromosome partitioning protein